MSDQWHYEQKGESYIKVDTLHKIRTLESELTAVTEQLKETQEALAAEIKHHTDIRTAVGDPTAKLMQDELVERCRRMSAVIDAARCIRHWHDREPDGMVVSKSHVFALWQTLNELDKPNADVLAPAGEKTPTKQENE